MEQKTSKQVKKAAVLLYFILFGLYLVAFRGKFSSMDNEIIFRAAQSLVDRGQLDVRAGSGISVEGRDGKRYCKSGLGGILAAVPFYYAGKFFSRWLARDIQVQDPVRKFVLLANVLITPLICVVFLLFALELGCGLRPTALVALAMGVTTLFWPYSQTYYTQVPVAFCLLAAAYYSRLNARIPALWRSALVGALIGISFLYRVETIIPGIIIAFYFLYQWTRIPADGKRKRKILNLLMPVVSFAPFAAVWLAYNYFRFGSVFSTGYDFSASRGVNSSLVDGLFLYLLSPGKSIFFFCPVIALGIWAWFAFRRRRGAEAWLIAALALFYLLFHAKIWSFNFDVSWGPRFLIPVIPFLLLPLPDALSSGSETERKKRFRVFAAVSILSLMTTIPGVMIRHYDFYRIYYGSNWSRYMPLTFWVPSQSPVLGQAKLLLSRRGGSEGARTSQPLPPAPKRNFGTRTTPSPSAAPESKTTPAQSRTARIAGAGQSSDTGLGADFLGPPQKVDLLIWNGITGTILNFKYVLAVVFLVLMIVLCFRGFYYSISFEGVHDQESQKEEKDNK